MNPEKRAQQIEKAVLKAAQKARRCHPDQPVTREELLQLRVQLAPPWQRILLVFLGLVFIGFGSAVVLKASVVFGIILGVVGLLPLLLGILGRKKPLEACVGGLEVTATVVEAILTAINVP